MDRADRRRARIYWLCQGAGWTIYLGLWAALSLVLNGPLGPRVAAQLVVTACDVVISIAWTHAYRAVIRRRGWAGLGPGRLAPRLIAGSVVVGAAIAVSAIPLAPIYGDVARPIRVWLPWAFATAALSVAAWSLVYFAVHYFEGWRQAERDKAALAVHAAEAKLHFLVAQLNPHFLFNCLSSVRALIAEDPAKAHAAVTALSQLIRYSLQATQVPTVPLAAELDMIETYLSLETMRFEERLRRDLRADADTRDLPIPPMIVQALVENGVKHGIERTPAGGTITVTSWRDADTLRVRVTNPGALILAPDTTRVGLRNTRERLRLLYGERAGLAMRQDADAVIAELSLPIAQAAP